MTNSGDAWEPCFLLSVPHIERAWQSHCSCRDTAPQRQDAVNRSRKATNPQKCLSSSSRVLLASKNLKENPILACRNQVRATCPARTGMTASTCLRFLLCLETSCSSQVKFKAAKHASISNISTVTKTVADISVACYLFLSFLSLFKSYIYLQFLLTCICRSICCITSKNL